MLKAGIVERYPASPYIVYTASLPLAISTPRAPLRQLRQYLYFCASKASKLGTCWLTGRRQSCSSPHTCTCNVYILHAHKNYVLYIYYILYIQGRRAHILPDADADADADADQATPRPPPHKNTPQVRRPDEHNLARHCGGVFKGSVEIVIARRAPLAVCGICGTRGAKPRLQNAQHCGAINALLRRY
jgi:hypothetical protein